MNSNNNNTKQNIQPTIRRVGSLGGVLYVTIPIELAMELGIKKGDYVKVLTDDVKTVAFEKIEIE